MTGAGAAWPTKQQQRRNRDRPGGQRQHNDASIGCQQRTAALRRQQQQRQRRSAGFPPPAPASADVQPFCATGHNCQSSAPAPVKSTEIRHSPPPSPARRLQPAARTLTPIQALVQEQYAQQHVDQRIDEIAQAGFQDASFLHRPDVDQPVRGNQQGRQQIKAQAPRPAGRRARPDPVSRSPARPAAPAPNRARCASTSNGGTLPTSLKWIGNRPQKGKAAQGTEYTADIRLSAARHRALVRRDGSYAVATRWQSMCQRLSSQPALPATGRRCR